MKKMYEKPMLISEEFKIKEHVAHGCSHKPKNREIKCDYEGHENDHSHKISVFMNSQAGCSYALNSIQEVRQFNKGLFNCGEEGKHWHNVNKISSCFGS